MLAPVPSPVMANSNSWRRMKRVFSVPWGKKSRNPPPPATPSFDELTSSPGIFFINFLPINF